MDDPAEDAPARTVALTIPDEAAGQRLDKALALAAELAGLSLSRSRLGTLLTDGAVTGADGVAALRDRATAAACYTVTLPRPVAAEPEPEAIPLNILYEDAHLIVVNKPAGMVVHPAPGAETGTLVNALLHHCGESLTGIGGARRPGIVHRIDKETSGVLVSAKTEKAHAHLSELFAAHDVHRRYLAVTWGAPSRADPRLAGLSGISFEDGNIVCIDAPLARHAHDRKRMAVTRTAGRRALTRMRTIEAFGPNERPFASLAECWLETGRTHQIRVHATYAGHALIGDPVYGRARALSQKDATEAQREILKHFPRQALHASELGFTHPETGKTLEFRADLPADMAELLGILKRIP